MFLRSAKEKKKYEQIIKQQDNMYAKWKNYKNAPCAIIIGKPNDFINLSSEAIGVPFFFLESIRPSCALQNLDLINLMVYFLCPN